jgi:hypothetical protein
MQNRVRADVQRRTDRVDKAMRSAAEPIPIPTYRCSSLVKQLVVLSRRSYSKE